MSFSVFLWLFYVVSCVGSLEFVRGCCFEGRFFGISF